MHAHTMKIGSNIIYIYKYLYIYIILEFNAWFSIGMSIFYCNYVIVILGYIEDTKS